MNNFLSRGVDANPERLKMIRIIYLFYNLYIMKSLKELKGAKLLSKKEQQVINGGKAMCLWGPDGLYCNYPYVCVNGICVLSPE
jgi:hypothetical protein